MKQILIELDDQCAQDLERVAPAKDRKRAEFVRLAIRRAVDDALDRTTAEAYVAKPLQEGLTAADLAGWDPQNGLARSPRRTKSRRSGAKGAA